MKSPNHPTYPRPRLTPTAKREAQDVINGAVAAIIRRTPRLVGLQAEHDRMVMLSKRRYIYCHSAYSPRWGHGSVRDATHSDLVRAMATDFAQDLATQVRAEALTLLGVQDEERAIVAIARTRLLRAALRAPVNTLPQKRSGEVLRKLAEKRARLAEEARRRLESIVDNAYSRADYRRASSSWVGGENSVRVDVGTPDVRSSVDTVWHKKHTWKGSNLHVRITVASDWESTVWDRDLDVIEDRLTLSVSQVLASETEEAYEATWVEQSRGLSLTLARGTIYRRRVRAGGAWLPWVHAKNLRGARAVYARQMAHLAEVA